MKAISIYQRRGFLHVCPSVFTAQGVGIESGPCVKLPVLSTSATELGEVALRSLEGSGAIVPHPTDWTRRPPSPVLASAGVKSWRTFSRGARRVGIVHTEDRLILNPTRQAGDMNFMALDDDQKLHLPGDCTAEALGEAIERALARCR